MKIEGDRVRIDFAHSDGGLHAQPCPVGFALAGADHKWFAADATIAGDAVELHSDQVKSPVAVRYGWAENPEVNLFNGAGLPVAPFRTDDWPE
jgi:sialate O-acetylesterase